MRTRSLKKIGKAALLTAGTLAAMYVGSSLAMAWMMVCPSRRSRYDTVTTVRHGKMHAVELLAAWILFARNAEPQNWVILLHGYRSDRQASHRRLKFFAHRGFNVLLLHFRGHGASQPKRISYGYNERLDVQAAADYLRSLPLGGCLRIGIDGRSMGAAAAAFAVGSGEIKPAWMILESCYDRIENALSNRLALKVGGSLAPFVAWPIELVVEQLIHLRVEDLDPAKALERSHCPILVLAGDSEKVLKVAEIEYLYGCVPEPKRLALFPGAGHEDLLAYDPRRFIRVVDTFLQDFGLRR